jgi:ubiquinone/menaquinone biosynthesis C-methylase UbiE
MKDNFTAVASGYSQFRPHYPDEMIDYIVSLVANRETALDVATGNGQVAVALSKHFRQVIATDISEAQLQKAMPSDNITYKVATAEDMPFDAQVFDLVAVAQAVHWFDFDRFYAEVRRVLKPDGIIAVMGYGLFSTNPGSDKILRDFYDKIVGPYWDAERRYLDENYTTIPFPFDEIDAPEFVNRFQWSFDQLTGYLETWSATQHYKVAKKSNPVDLIRESLRETWENSNKEVVFPLLLRVGRL